MKIAIMIAIMVFPSKGNDVNLSLNVLAFKTLHACLEKLEPVKKELLKSTPKIELGCIERDLY